MPSLRTLLDAPDPNAISFDTGTAPNWQRNPVDSHLFYAQYGMCSYNQDYDNDCWSEWCIEGGMDIITFELWGAGGGGAGSCCCGWGPPGGSGAYTTIIIDNTGNDYVQDICLCVAVASCCSPDRTCGYRGCQTQIAGSGLCNICAEGGRPGCSICNFFDCFPNSGCGVIEHPCNTDCACFFGCATQNPGGEDVFATGVPGRYGWIQTDCTSPGNFCWYKVALPIPAGLGTNDTSYKMVRASCNTGARLDMCHVSGWANDNATGGTNGVSWPVGVGGNTARVCGGGCCCGTAGGPGLIKISWT